MVQDEEVQGQSDLSLVLNRDRADLVSRDRDDDLVAVAGIHALPGVSCHPAAFVEAESSDTGLRDGSVMAAGDIQKEPDGDKADEDGSDPRDYSEYLGH